MSRAKAIRQDVEISTSLCRMRYIITVVQECAKMDGELKLRAWRVLGFAGRIHLRRRIHFPLRSYLYFGQLGGLFPRLLIVLSVHA
jgi:hypothetical protein